MSSARRYLVGSWRTLSSAFTLDPTTEKFAFARFRNDDGDELSADETRRRTLNTSDADLNLTDACKTSPCGGGLTVDGKVESTADEQRPMKADHGDAHRALSEGGTVGNGGSPKSNQNRISAWQAGWNVTNAIQVK